MFRTRSLALLAAMLMALGVIGVAASPAQAGTGLFYTVVDADRDPYNGIYLRNSTGNFADATRTSARYIPYGTRIELICGTWGVSVGQDGDPNRPNYNRRWHQITIPNGQVGWMPDRYLNTPNVANQLTPNEPECGQSGGGNPAPQQPQPLPGGGGAYYQPRWSSGDPYPPDSVLTISRDKWSYDRTGAPRSKADCKTDKVDDHLPADRNGKRVTTIGTWSVARLAPVYLIEHNFERAKQLDFIILYDPGSYANFTDPSSCDQFFDQSAAYKKWLDANPNAVLMVLAGRDTRDPNWAGVGRHKGLQDKVLSKLRGYGYNRVVVCDYRAMSHPDVLRNFSGMMAGGKTTACPGQYSARWTP
ncbi:MAG TPA: hypothetical protein VJM32_05340 [Candidatus Saccharimonadales bacterium]|nr:hypothetical protein [Candidatus Saccharimonadales bacterium]